MARVLFLGRLREIAGMAEWETMAPTLSALRREISARDPALGQAISAASVHVAVDMVIRRDDAGLTAASEVAFLPPLSGG